MIHVYCYDPCCYQETIALPFSFVVVNNPQVTGEISQRYGLFEILKPHRPIFITMVILIQNIFGISQCLDCLILWYFGLRFFAVLWSKAAMGETMDARAEEHVGNLNSIRTASSNPQICF